MMTAHARTETERGRKEWVGKGKGMYRGEEQAWPRMLTTPIIGDCAIYWRDYIANRIFRGVVNMNKQHTQSWPIISIDDLASQKRKHRECVSLLSRFIKEIRGHRPFINRRDRPHRVA